MASTSRSPGFHPGLVPKLEGSNNYEIWKVRVTSCLKSYDGVWRLFEGTDNEPQQHEGELDDDFQDRLNEHRTTEAQARDIIVSTCQPDIQRTLEDVKTAKACWEKLNAQYSNELQPEGVREDVLDIWISFAQRRYEGEPIEKFCDNYRAALAKCASVDIAISDKIQVLHFLASLGDRYEQWCANKRELMRLEPTNFPGLDGLMKELVDESRDRELLNLVAALADLPIPTSRATCDGGPPTLGDPLSDTNFTG